MDDTTDSIPYLLAECKTIAVVGLSQDLDRPSHGVAKYLQAQGYRVIPVNPKYAGAYILGEYCYVSLSNAAGELKKQGVDIDLVDCFRKAEDILPIAEEAIAIGAKGLWLQLGVINEAAAETAREAGLRVVMDHCIKIEHQYWARK